MTTTRGEPRPLTNEPNQTVRSDSQSKDLTNPPTQSNGESFPVVGLGASAGGLEALTEFFGAMAIDSGMAFVVICHLDPAHKSAMSQILATVTAMPVAEVQHGMHVAPNHVYIIPPNTVMVLAEGALHLSGRSSVSPPTPIDAFFASLASNWKNQAIGVILSGTGADGVRGLADIKAGGGVTFAQDQTAKHDGMPRTAVQSGSVDFVLPPALIAAELGRLGHHPYLERNERIDGLAQPPGPNDESAFQSIVQRLSQASGVDFANYKDSTFRRRIQRRLMLLKLSGYPAYLSYLQREPEEIRALFDDVLIQVTSFFRDPEVFDALRRDVFPYFLEDRPAGSPIRVWIPGCASGQEAYSLAIYLLEFLREKDAKIPVKIFGTDLSEQTVGIARAGVYRENVLKDVSPERVERFFDKTDGTYRIKKFVRDLCVFAKQDVTHDPPFSHIDLISCRNLLIYLGPRLQDRVLSLFHYALQPKGFLMLGSAESISSMNELFEPLDRKHKLYRRLVTPSRWTSDFSFRTTGAPGGVVTEDKESHSAGFQSVPREADRVVLERYAPCGVVIDERWQVVQFRGQTGKYLEMPPGSPTHALLPMAREGLLSDLQAILEQARRDNLPITRQVANFGGNHGDIPLELVVLPIRVPPTDEKYYLVLFEQPSPERTRHHATADRPLGGQDSDKDREILRLKQELGAMRSYLQSLLQEKDSANEELTVANEEIITSNEELRSTNEEVETAKEELQSAYEELTTVNAELETRILMASRLGDDLVNLIDATNIPTVVIDGDLNLRRYTPSAQRLMNLTPADIGRSVSDFKLKISVPDLEPLLQRVLTSHTMSDLEVTDQQGHWHKMITRPYKTADDVIDGVVITLYDIDLLKQREQRLQKSEQALHENEHLLRAVMDSLPGYLAVLDPDGCVLAVNMAWLEFGQANGLPNEGAGVGTNYLTVCDSAEGRDADFGHRAATGIRGVLSGARNRYELEYPCSDGITNRWFMLKVSPLRHDDRRGAVVLHFDITARIKAEEAVRLREAHLRAILDTAADAIITIHESGTIESVNPATERMFGYAAAEMVGQDISLLIPELPHAEPSDSKVNNSRVGMEKIREVGGEIQGRQKNGGSLSLELAISRIGNEQMYTGILRDSSSRKALEREVLEIATAEQMRIGQDLHDDVGQELTGIGLMAAALTSRLQVHTLPPNVPELGAKIREGLERVRLRVRALSQGLIAVPIDAQGLRAALEDLANRTREQSGISCTFNGDSTVAMEDNQTATHLFRIAQEAISNALRHGSASQVEISLEESEEALTLRIRDDGMGLTPVRSSPEGLGIPIMRYRGGLIGGTVQVGPAEEGGTLVTCTLPKGRHREQAFQE